MHACAMHACMWPLTAGVLTFHQRSSLLQVALLLQLSIHIYVLELTSFALLGPVVSLMPTRREKQLSAHHY